MTETIPLPNPPAETVPADPISSQDPPIHPSQVLLHLIVTILARVFLGASGGDLAIARMAALATVNAYTARNDAELICIGQIIAYGLAAMSALSHSMDESLPLPLALRLRGNANALDRAAEHNRRALEKARAAPIQAALTQPEPAPVPTPAPEPVETEQEAAILATLAETKQRTVEAQARLHTGQPLAKSAKPVLALQDQQIQAEWAAAMADVAIEFTANIAGLPPAERQEASRRAALLSTCANELLSGSVPPDLESAIGPALAELRALQSAQAPQRSPIGRSRTA